jgi:hypothetical protein
MYLVFTYALYSCIQKTVNGFNDPPKMTNTALGGVDQWPSRPSPEQENVDSNPELLPTTRTREASRQLTGAVTVTASESSISSSKY